MMVVAADIPELADIPNQGQLDKIRNAVLVLISDALGGGGGTTLEDVRQAIDDLDLTLNLEGTQLTINANIDEVEGLMKAVQAVIGAAIPASAHMIGVEDAGLLITLKADPTTKGAEVHVVSAPAHEETGATDAYRNILVDIAGAIIGSLANPFRNQRVLPSAVINETANTSGTPNTATNPFTGTPKGAVNIQNDPGNGDSIFVGNSAGQDTEIALGLSAGGFEIDDLSKLYVKSPTASQKVNILGG